ncbi:hypothetical protein B0A65_16240 [Flavobacterium frigidimaris]|uniref:Uncharacterized protein n=1 Tax=Flavobacterium frigidimaris TaxID=262320 RepID=A0ABX4BMP6_FLAFR|nr:hypothetical protein B0A65_16240 [Flavobacterium frigidimaris]
MAQAKELSCLKINFKNWLSLVFLKTRNGNPPSCSVLLKPLLYQHFKAIELKNYKKQPYTIKR